MTPQVEGALVVLPSGEAVARSAPLEELTQAVDTVGEMKQQLADAEAVLSDELLSRLDRRGQWTLRTEIVGDVQWEITAPSPTAGTTAYDLERLADELDKLVDQEVIDGDLASEALERKVVVTFLVSDERGIRLIETAAREDQRVQKVDVSRSAKAGAIARIEKIGDVAKAAVERARRRVEPPPRKARVKRKDKRA